MCYSKSVFKKSILKKDPKKIQSQLMLSFKTYTPGHERETNPI